MESQSYYISFEGRITLTKTTLSNLPINYLSTFKIPKGIAREIESLQNRFLWRGKTDFKTHLINSEIVSRAKKNGSRGMGGILKEMLLF